MPKKLAPKGQAAPPPEPDTPPTPRKKKPAAKKARKRATKKQPDNYLRNLHEVEARVTMISTERRIELKPRGQRGDLAKLKEEEIGDEGIDLYVVEVISKDSAQEIIKQQSTNQQAPHAALAVLRNELGQPYQQAPQIAQPYEQQGQVVAQVQPAPDGRNSERNTQIIREPGQPPQQAAVPGSVQNPIPQIPANIPPEQVSDWLARQGVKTNDEAAANAAAEQLRGTLNVNVQPPQQT